LKKGVNKCRSVGELWVRRGRKECRCSLKRPGLHWGKLASSENKKRRFTWL